MPHLRLRSNPAPGGPSSSSPRWRPSHRRNTHDEQYAPAAVPSAPARAHVSPQLAGGGRDGSADANPLVEMLGAAQGRQLREDIYVVAISNPPRPAACSPPRATTATATATARAAALVVLPVGRRLEQRDLRDLHLTGNRRRGRLATARGTGVRSESGSTWECKEA
jgi:hypothetical protein